MLGLQVRTIDVAYDDQFALRGKALRDALEEDARIGHKPFILGNVFSQRYSFSSPNFTFDQLQLLEPPHPVQLTTSPK